ncbi:hypothetical protein UPYG_G00074130 [Umbra pygmaea]|uniref:Uncharacterized protein n=1 Tax=Umbra pygmaea TaxID=75934 RepID=A0ABD0XCC5_UMBPY
MFVTLIVLILEKKTLKIERTSRHRLKRSFSGLRKHSGAVIVKNMYLHPLEECKSSSWKRKDRQILDMKSILQ